MIKQRARTKTVRPRKMGLDILGYYDYPELTETFYVWQAICDKCGETIDENPLRGNLKVNWILSAMSATGERLYFTFCDKCIGHLVSGYVAKTCNNPDYKPETYDFTRIDY